MRNTKNKRKCKIGIVASITFPTIILPRSDGVISRPWVICYVRQVIQSPFGMRISSFYRREIRTYVYKVAHLNLTKFDTTGLPKPESVIFRYYRVLCHLVLVIRTELTEMKITDSGFGKPVVSNLVRLRCATFFL